MLYSDRRVGNRWPDSTSVVNRVFSAVTVMMRHYIALTSLPRGILDDGRLLIGQASRKCNPSLKVD
jgi:hypothetical protein